MNDRLPFGTQRLLWFVSPDAAEAIAGDLAEEAALVAAAHGERCARRWLLRQILASIAPLARRHVERWAFPAAAGVVSALATATALGVFWRYILFLVPLRAQHAPPLPLLLVGIAVSITAALLGFTLGCILDPRRHFSREAR